MRLKRVEIIRLFAIFMIVWAHSQFFDGVKAETVSAQAWELGIILMVRFSIQFFFLTSGYFLGGKIIDNPGQSVAIAWKYTQKLLLIFAVWSIVYAVNDPQSAYRLFMKSPLTLLFEGTRIHLWFLMSLSLVIWVFALWPWNKKGYSILLFGGVLYVVGLLAGSYRPTPIGIDLDFNTRNGIFFGMLYFAMGALIHVKKPRIHPLVAWGLYAGGLIWFGLETYFLWANWSALPVRHDFLLGSIPYGLGTFLISLSAKRDTKLDIALAPYSQYVLGIYVSHLLFLDLWKPLGQMMPYTIWLFLSPLLVFGSSLLAVMLLSKTPLRRLVM